MLQFVLSFFSIYYYSGGICKPNILRKLVHFSVNTTRIKRTYFSLQGVIKSGMLFFFVVFKKQTFLQTIYKATPTRDNLTSLLLHPEPSLSHLIITAEWRIMGRVYQLGPLGPRVIKSVTILLLKPGHHHLYCFLSLNQQAQRYNIIIS